MTQQELAATARDMRAQLQRPGYVERVLKDRGTPVYLRLLRRHDSVQLFVGHRDGYPNPESAAQIAAHFGVGPETDPLPAQIRIASQDGISIPVRCLLFAWTEANAGEADA